MRNLFVFFCLFLSVAAIGQSPTLTDFYGKIEFSGFAVGGTADIVGTLANYNDQTNLYFANNVQVGDVAWDNLGRRWEVMVVNSSNLLQANVDLRDINGSGAIPTGVGYISRETENIGLSLFVPGNNIGISQQLKSRVESHNMLLLDQYIGSIRDSVYQGATAADTADVVDPTVGDVLVTNDGDVLFFDGDTWITFTGGGGGGKSVYNAGQGFYCYCSPGVTVISGSQGVYSVTIPTDADVSSIQKEFTNAGSEFTVGGEAVINIAWAGAGGNWNTAFSTAILPNVKLIDGAGTQREPGAVAVTAQTTSVSGGSSSTTLANINGVGTPVRIKIAL